MDLAHRFLKQELENVTDSAEIRGQIEGGGRNRMQKLALQQRREA